MLDGQCAMGDGREGQEVTDNIMYMKLFHEYKQLFPKVPDRTVGQTVRQHGGDKDICTGVLAEEEERAGRAGRRYSLQDLLSHQMRQQLLLSGRLQWEKKKLESLRSEMNDIDMKFNRRQLQLKACISKKTTSAMESRVMDLETECCSFEQAVRDMITGAGSPGLEDVECRSPSDEETPPLVYGNVGGASNHVPSASPTISSSSPSTSPEKGTNFVSSSATKSARKRTKARKLAHAARDVVVNLLSKHRGSSSIAPVTSPTMGSNDSQISGNELQWSCSACTFLNHPALQHCEQCEMPQITIGTAKTSNSEEQASQPCFCHPEASATRSHLSASSSSLASSETSPPLAEGVVALAPSTSGPPTCVQ